MVAGSPGGYLLVLQLQNTLQEPVFTTSLNPNSRYVAFIRANNVEKEPYKEKNEKPELM